MLLAGTSNPIPHDSAAKTKSQQRTKNKKDIKEHKIKQSKHQKANSTPHQALTPLALTSPLSPIFSSFLQSGQYHLVVRAGMSASPTHSRWNHSCLHA